MRLASIFAYLCLILFVPSSAAQTSAAEEPEANPGRPTIATPATLTPVGYLQFETGALWARTSPEFSSGFGLNEVMKLTVVPRLEFLVSAAPIAHSTAHGLSANQVADFFVGAQVLLKSGEGAKPSIAAGYFRRIYSGPAPNLDFGSPINSLILLVSADVKGFHYDGNAMVNEVVQGLGRRAQFGQTLSISHPLIGKFGVTGEIWHFTQPFLRGNAVGNLWALSYTPRKTLVLDAGFNRGLTRTSTQWEAFAGFTYLLPKRLWGR